jgi:hypothetical protein
MKSYRSRNGPFVERPYYSSQDIEELCTEELRKVGLLPPAPAPVRIDRFIEKRFGIVPEFDKTPAGILGFTQFTRDGVAAIVVSRAVADERTPVAKRRINTTLAHECGHGLLQSHLFALGRGVRSLFENEVSDRDRKILCRTDAVVGESTRRAYDGRWWEHQANLCIGALLLPRALAHAALRPLLVPRGTFGRAGLPTEHRARAEEILSAVFDVNEPVARIRVKELFPEDDGRQLTL